MWCSGIHISSFPRVCWCVGFLLLLFTVLVYCCGLFLCQGSTWGIKLKVFSCLFFFFFFFPLYWGLDTELHTCWASPSTEPHPGPFLGLFWAWDLPWACTLSKISSHIQLLSNVAVLNFWSPKGERKMRKPKLKNGTFKSASPLTLLEVIHLEVVSRGFDNDYMPYGLHFWDQKQQSGHKPLIFGTQGAFRSPVP